jgi:hypothetical protein
MALTEKQMRVKATLDIVQRERGSEKLMPLEIMLDLMHDSHNDYLGTKAKLEQGAIEKDDAALEQKFKTTLDAAKECASYFHAKLSSVQVDSTHTVELSLSVEQLAKRMLFILMDGANMQNNSTLTQLN